MELTLSPEVEGALGPPYPHHVPRPVSLLQNSTTNGKQTRQKKSYLPLQPVRQPVASRNPRNAGPPQQCSAQTASPSSSRTIWWSSGYATHQTQRRETASLTSRRISELTNKRRSSLR